MDARTFFTDIIPISDPALREQVAALSQIYTLPKGELVLREGDRLTHIHFLLSGILRGFFLDYNGRDITDCFGVRCGVPAMPTFQFDSPCFISIETLTECRLLRIPLEPALYLLQHDTRLMQIYNQLLQHSLMEHWQIKTALHKRTAMERYLWFLETYPGLIDQVTHRYIASFLEISPVTLSRLRAALKQGVGKD